MIPTPPFSLSAQGFRSKRLDDIVTDLNNAMEAQFGDVNLAPQSVFGQIVGVMAKAYADIWENMNYVYSSEYPNSAFGVSLDNVVGLNGITRLNQTQTQVWASCTGNEGTLIPLNALASIPNTNFVFAANPGGVITQSSADFANIAVGTLAGQIYTVNINSVPFIYSLPIITFTGAFGAGNNTTVFINGIAQPTVNFITDTNTTVAAIATQIALDPAVLSATPVGPVISIVPNPGFSVTINAITIVGLTPPTTAITFGVPATANQVSLGLVSVINAGTPTWLAVNLTGTFTITTLNELTPFAIGLGVNLSLTTFTTPISFICQQYGPIPCPVGALTLIVTPIGGWNAINNMVAGTLGTLTETDAQLRIRRKKSINLFGLATVQAIESHLINVPGVTNATVFENVTLQETSMVITFSGDVLAGQVINVSFNGGSGTFNVSFNTDQATTMADLANAFLALPEVATAVVSGANLVLTLTFKSAQVLTMITGDVTVTGTGTLPTAIVAGGQPPKSIQAVVQGGTSLAIATEIWLTKPAGIQTFGNTTQVIVDSQGNNQTILFSRPTPIYIWVGASLTLYPGETFPANGVVLVAQAIYNYGISLGVGVEVLIQRVQNSVFTVPGIGSVIIQLAATTTPTGSPFFSNVDIPINTTQISAWDLDRIAVVVI